MAQAQERGVPLETAVAAVGLSVSTYRRWLRAAHERTRAPETRRGRPPVAPPTPREIALVRQFALRHPYCGYKRLTWLLAQQEAVWLRPYQVYAVLRELGLLNASGARPAVALRRPSPPTAPDEVWHSDIMYLRVRQQWFYLVDILDGYSRYVVHWSLNPTMTADTVTRTLQEALEKNAPLRGQPAQVHDHGCQYTSHEWKQFVQGAGLRDIRTRVAHPESNGKVERLHRTHREEGLAGQDWESYGAAVDALAGWVRYYNEARPHAALHYLCPRDYYRGDPSALLAIREAQFSAAATARRTYWETQEAAGDAPENAP